MSPLRYFIGCLVAVTGLLSCKKDSADIKGDPKVKFFTNLEAPGNAPQNSMNYAVVNHPDPAGNGLLNLSGAVPAEIKFPVLASKPVSRLVEIGAELDNSLVTKFNEANNTNYALFPAGFLNAADLSVQIPAGDTRSSDSITITANLANLTSLTEKAYMAAIKLKTVSDLSVGEITNNTATQVAYIVVNVEIRQIRYNATAASAVGTLISPRTSWTVLLNPAPTSIGGNGSIIDGLTTSYSRWGVSPGQVDVNIQASRNVTGIRLYTTATANQIPTQVEVYLSTDGINLDHIGSPLRANLTYASSYNYILFYKPIPAQYIRLRLLYGTSTNTQNTRITEFDVYAN